MANLSKLKGQEIKLVCSIDGKAEDRIGPFLDLDVTLRKEVLEGEYLGESTTYFDTVFRGCQLSAKGHLRGAHWLKLIDRDIRRARHLSGGLVRFDLTAVLIFPGLILPWTFGDIQFGDHKVSVSDRKSYVEGALDMYCSENPTLPNIA